MKQFKDNVEHTENSQFSGMIEQMDTEPTPFEKCMMEAWQEFKYDINYMWCRDASKRGQYGWKLTTKEIGRDLEK
jgi:hypothetical protein